MNMIKTHWRKRKIRQRELVCQAHKKKLDVVDEMWACIWELKMMQEVERWEKKRGENLTND